MKLRKHRSCAVQQDADMAEHTPNENPRPKWVWLIIIILLAKFSQMYRI